MRATRAQSVILDMRFLCFVYRSLADTRFVASSEVHPEAHLPCPGVFLVLQQALASGTRLIGDVGFVSQIDELGKQLELLRQTILRAQIVLNVIFDVAVLLLRWPKLVEIAVPIGRRRAQAERPLLVAERQIERILRRRR